MTRAILEKVESTTTVDFGELRYISSAGLGLLLATQKRLIDSGSRLEIANMSPHIRDIFTIAGFDFLFDIK
jgi:anti-sigma B factor antagonist